MVAVAIGGAALIGGATSVIAGNKAAKASKQAAAMQAENERYFYDTSREDYAPYREVGQGALYKLANMYGVETPTKTDWSAYVMGNPDVLAAYQQEQANKKNQFANMDEFGEFHYNKYGQAENRPTAAYQTGGTTGTSGNYGGFQASPGYQFRLDEGLKATERSAAARGGLRSGATLKALQRYGEGLASSEYENYANRLASLAGIGQSATAGTSAAGAQAAGGISSAYQQAGQARASAYQNTGNAINQTVGNLAGAYLYNQGYGKTGGGAYGVQGSGGIY